MVEGGSPPFRAEFPPLSGKNLDLSSILWFSKKLKKASRAVALLRLRGIA
ncbi:MAG TPA: hypothetical protein IAB50_09275 [Candidatus Faecivicinus avistercoris]|nr:hypothetical protein [Candidatus Faecivicinus avistercoris]